MRKLSIGDVTITSIVERDGPWRKPEEMFPAYDPTVGKRHLAQMDAEVFDPASSPTGRPSRSASGARRCSGMRPT